MKKITIVSVAALVMLGAGPVFAPNVVSVCTEPDPGIARVATQYYNDLGFTQRGVDLGALPAALGQKVPIVYDTTNPSNNDKLDLQVEKLQKAVATAVGTAPAYVVNGAAPNPTDNTIAHDMLIVDADLNNTTPVPLAGATSLQERIIRVGKAVEADGEGTRAAKAPDTMTPAPIYPDIYTPLAVRLDDVNSLIGTKKFNSDGRPVDADGNVVDGEGQDDNIVANLATAVDNFPFSKWNDTAAGTSNNSIHVQTKNLLAGLKTEIARVSAYAIPNPDVDTTFEKLWTALKLLADG